jgi:type II secretory pathway component PulF
MQEAATSYDVRSLMTYPSFVLTMFVGLIVSSLVFLVPVVKVLRRTGHSALWCLLAFVPGLNLIAFWVFAFKPWPADKITSIGRN